MPVASPPSSMLPRTIYPMRTPQEKRTAYLQRLSGLRTERSSWDAHWMDIGRHILPRSGRFFTTDRNQGGKQKYGSIIDNCATRASRVLAAGMHAGLTSPARPWFKLRQRDPALRAAHRVNLWLDDAVDRMQDVFSSSNVYRMLPRIYKECGAFGTGATMPLFDFESLIHCFPLTLGQYALQQNWKGQITTVYREFQRTVGEVVKEFGYKNCSQHVQSAFDNRQHENEVEILHVIEPRADQDRDLRSNRAVDMPWRSIYLELSGTSDKILREGGFKRMPVLAPRWTVDGDDVYGSNCPGMEALGDVRQLQQEQLKKATAINYMVEPPLQVPQELLQRRKDGLPGGESYFEPRSMAPYDQQTPNGGIRSMFDVRLDLNHMLVDIQDVRERIDRAFYVDLFLMLATQDGRMTATEVIERQEEKLLMIGPVIERMTNDLLEPLIDITFHQMLEVGALPPPPPELYGSDLQVEFVSILAQAQKAVGITSTQQWMGDLVQVAQTRPDVLDVVNFDAWARKTAHMRGVDNELLVDEASVQRLRDARAKAEAAQEQMAMMREGAGAVKDLSTAPVDQGSALDAILAQSTGYGVPAA